MKHLVNLFWKIKSAFLLIALSLSIFYSAAATEYFDTKGRDFWLAFLPNFHEYDNNDSLYIFITCDKATKGRIDYKNEDNNSFSEDFIISDPSKIISFKVPAGRFELLGYNESGYMGDDIRNNSERIAPQSFHILADDEVTVYAHSQAKMTSEAFLVIPTDVLQNHYYVMSYNSDGKIDDFGDLDFSSTPSQFAIVATEDNTEVTIIPSCPTKYNGNTTQKINLNKGEIYLVQALISMTLLNADLTGTEIISDKPVAVFGGHQRSTIPVEHADSLASRDILIEQMPPIVTWGENGYVIPFIQYSGASTAGDDIFRVMAAEDNTKVYYNGAFLKELNKGEFHEGAIGEASFINADGPILVAQYKQTSGDLWTPGTPYSDPLMLIMPPREQFMSSYRVINLQAYEAFSKVYLEQYITVIVNNSSLDKLVIDGTALPQDSFLPIPGSEYSYAHKRTSDGTHAVSCDTKFGIFVYGYGQANSYGYIGGMSLQPIDETPAITSTDSCYAISGAVVDSMEMTSGLKEVISPVDYEENVEVTIAPFNFNDKIVEFSASLVDIRKDGKFRITERDTSGNVAERDFQKAGMTLASPGNRFDETIPVHRAEVKPGEEHNFSIILENYGSFVQTIEKIWVSNSSQFELSLSAPFAIQPSTSEKLDIRYLTQNDTIISDTLRIETNCGMKKMLIINLNSGKCDASAFEYLDFSDMSNISLLGKARQRVDTLRLTNSFENISGAAWHKHLVPVKKGFSTEFTFVFSNPNNGSANENSLPGADGIAFVIQNSGIDAIGGYGGDIGYSNIPNSLAIEFDTFSNDSLQMDDYFDPNGNHIAVQSGGKGPNSARHISPYLIAMAKDITLIKPYEMRYYVKIDYNGDDEEMNIYMDKTGKFEEPPALTVDNLNISSILDLEQGEWAYVGFTSATGTAREVHDILDWIFCPFPTSPIIGVEESSIAQGDRNFKIYPNPFASQLNIEVFNKSGNNIKVGLYSILGQKVADIAGGYMPAGSYNFAWDGSKYLPGTYICRIAIGSEVFYEKIELIKH